MKKKPILKEIAYHRNGVHGEPFYVIAFQSDDKDMIGVVFDYEEADAYEAHLPVNPRTAVFDRELLAKGEIRFMENSWRGDVFDPFLRQSIATHEREEASKI